MARYHINPQTGNIGRCYAKNKCRFGDMSRDHYFSPEEEREAYERKQTLGAHPIKTAPGLTLSSLQIQSIDRELAKLTPNPSATVEYDQDYDDHLFVTFWTSDQGKLRLNREDILLNDGSWDQD